MKRFQHTIPGRRFTPQAKRLGGRWHRLRTMWLSGNPICNRCGRPGEEVHHIAPRSQRPDLIYHLDNLETLCRECHDKHHNVSKATR